ncbi:MAG: hypothetical protein ACREMY_08920, partial [bacterium]
MSFPFCSLSVLLPMRALSLTDAPHFDRWTERFGARGLARALRDMSASAIVSANGATSRNKFPVKEMLRIPKCINTAHPFDPDSLFKDAQDNMLFLKSSRMPRMGECISVFVMMVMSACGGGTGLTSADTDSS